MRKFISVFVLLFILILPVQSHAAWGDGWKEIFITNSSGQVTKYGSSFDTATVLEAKAAGALQEKVKDEDENSTDKSGAEWISTGR